MATARTTGPISLARKSEIRGEAVVMSCPFAGMTRIRFKGFPRYRLGGSLSSLTGAPLGTPANVGPPGRVSTRGALRRLRANAGLGAFDHYINLRESRRETLADRCRAPP